MIEQRTFGAPFGSPWNPVTPSFDGYERPDRSHPALASLPAKGPIVTVVGTVREEAVPLERSLSIWSRQRLPAWLKDRVEYVVLDDGSEDRPDRVCSDYRVHGMSIRYVRARGPGGPCLLYTSPSPRDGATSRMPSSA